ncbi:MAG: DUF3368 domain-containing protein [Caldilinea sp.]|nr:DUF3368 domain-containing protein [Caldilinea sp.]
MAAGPVVVDAGPLMVLAKLNLLHLLKHLYGEIIVAEAVYREVIDDGIRQGYPDAATLYQYFQHEGWQFTHSPATSHLGPTAHLDRGEQESIVLAAERGVTLLIDEEEGRTIARSLGLTIRGTLGVLIAAYRAGLIDSDQLRFYFAEIERRTDIWISPALCRRLLQETLDKE